MFLGHYGLALGAKRLAPATSTGTLVMAAELADEVWPFLLLAGVEQVKVVPGLMAASSYDFVSYPISHSLLTGSLGGLLFGLIYFLFRRNLRGAVISGLLVVSHWVLDLFVHRPDLPLWPGGPRFGLGAWNSIPLTLALELLFFGGGLAIYLRTTKAKGWVGHIALWSFVAALLAIYLPSILMPGGGEQAGQALPGAKEIAHMALLLWLFVPWGYWINRTRAVRA